VYCNARKDATAVAAALRDLAKAAGVTEPTIELFVGGRRVKERVQARDALAELGLIAGTDVELERSAFLIATSAGEVGVDLDADHMVCDLVAWERMIQRLGRVNRRGGRDATVIVVVDSEPTPSDGTKKALCKRETSNAANRQLEELTKKLSVVQGERTTGPKGQKKSAEAKATDEERRQTEKDLKKSMSACQKRIRAFKDGDAKLVAHREAEVEQHRALRMVAVQQQLPSEGTGRLIAVSWAHAAGSDGAVAAGGAARRGGWRANRDGARASQHRTRAAGRSGTRAPDLVHTALAACHWICSILMRATGLRQSRSDSTRLPTP
jgi:hypothetical protein